MISNRFSRLPAPRPVFLLRSRKSCLLAVFLLAACCPACSEKPEAVSADALQDIIERTSTEKKIVSDINGAASPSTSDSLGKLKLTVVKNASMLREKEFLLRLIREDYRATALARQTAREILSFTGPTAEQKPMTLRPLDIKEIYSETVHMVQRSSRPAKLRILKDLEIYLVFRAAYDSLDHEDKLSLIRKWNDSTGSALPPKPEESTVFPLFWLRENPIFWKRGGRFWWWASHALMQDDNFRIEDDGRVLFILPDKKAAFSS